MRFIGLFWFNGFVPPSLLASAMPGLPDVRVRARKSLAPQKVIEEESGWPDFPIRAKSCRAVPPRCDKPGQVFPLHVDDLLHLPEIAAVELNDAPADIPQHREIEEP